MVSYASWDRWASRYDSDGEETSLKVPLSCVSEDYLRDLDLSQVTAECGKPMTQAEFDAYMKSRRGNTETTPTILLPGTPVPAEENPTGETPRRKA